MKGPLASLGLYGLAWLGMMVVAILNGVVREQWLVARMSPLAAHQCSTLLLLGLLCLFCRVLFQCLPLVSPGQACVVGFCWLLLTLGFEFGFGRFVIKRSWPSLLQEYNLQAGRLWLLIPLWLWGGPLLLYALR